MLGFLTCQTCSAFGVELLTDSGISTALRCESCVNLQTRRGTSSRLSLIHSFWHVTGEAGDGLGQGPGITNSTFGGLANFLPASKTEVRVKDANLQTEIASLQANNARLSAEVASLQAENAVVQAENAKTAAEVATLQAKNSEDEALLHTIALQVNELTPVNIDTALLGMPVIYKPCGDSERAIPTRETVLLNLVSWNPRLDLDVP